MRRAAVLLTAALALSAGATSADARGLRAARSVESSINSMRAQHGCGPLRLHLGLSRAAGRQARLLLADGELNHDAGTPMPQRLHRAAPSASLLGEDLAWATGTLARPRSIVRAWMHSPMHRRIMLDCRFSQLGVGIAAGRFGGRAHAKVYTADFAA
ncbi:MAG TPA: CAP domain-containing protein [Gaiellales bacterium]|jgi:uncharacterized protein YkwD|nr:CAP domain-containing protein [Gaiellales bacterium]